MKLSVSAGAFNLDFGGNSVAWQAPPRVLAPLLWDMFVTQPEDVLKWLNMAIWELHVADVRRTSMAVPIGASSSVQTENSAVSSVSHSATAVPNETSLAMPLGKQAAGATAMVRFKNEDRISVETAGSLRSETGSTASQVRICAVAEAIQSYNSSGGMHDVLRSSKSSEFKYHDVAGLRLPMPAMPAVPTEPSRQGNNVVHWQSERSNATDHITTIWSSHSSASKYAKEVSTAIAEGVQPSRPSHIARHSQYSQSGIRTSRGSRYSHGSHGENNFGSKPSVMSRLTTGSWFSSPSVLDHMKNQYGLGKSQPTLVKGGFGSFKSQLNLGEKHTLGAFHPTGQLSLTWTFVYVMSFLFELWVTPLEIVFSPDGHLPDWTSTTDAILLTIFVFDILMNFTTGYFCNGSVVMNRYKVVQGYLTGWFWIDIIALLPYILSLSSDEKGRAIRYVKLVRILRVVRVQWWTTCMWHALFRHVSLTLHNELLILIEAVRLQVVLFLFSHVLAILWAAMQSSTWAASDVEGAYGRYVESLAWAYACLTCGESMQPVQHTLRALTILGAVARLVFFTLVALCVMRIQGLTAEDPSLWQERVMAHLGQRGVSIATRIKTSLTLKQRSLVQEQQAHIDRFVHQHLPTRLRRELLNQLWSERLMTLGLIQCLVQWHNTFALELSPCVREELLPPWAMLFRCGELAHTAYNVLRGRMAVSQTEHKPLADYTKGQWVGELALVNSELVQTETIMCKERCELMAVPAQGFRKLLTRLGLDSRFEHFLHRTLWMGFCGRCGYFGDHFSKDCPQLKRPTWFMRVKSSVKQMALPQSFRAEEYTVDMDLARFLEAYQLEPLQTVLPKYNIRSLNDLMTAAVEEMLAEIDPIEIDSEQKKSFARLVRHFRRKMATCSSEVLANSGGAENHLIFISHYKVEAGTEAALMQKDLERLIEDDKGSPGHGLSSPIFVDSENLRDLNDLQDSVQRSHNLVLLLTPGVLRRPWVLVEIVTAFTEGVNIVPVEIQRVDLAFKYPDDVFFRNLCDGKQLDQEATELLASEGINLEELEKALRQVFKRIAIPFSPHKPQSIRQAELSEVLKQCIVRSQLSQAMRRHNSTNNNPDGSMQTVLDEVVNPVPHRRSEEASASGGMAVLKRQSTRNRLSTAAGRATDDLYFSEGQEADDKERESVARRLSKNSQRGNSQREASEEDKTGARSMSLRNKMSRPAAEFLENALAESMTAPPMSGLSSLSDETDF